MTKKKWIKSPKRTNQRANERYDSKCILVRITVFPEWNSVTRLSVIVVAIVLACICRHCQCAVTFTTAAAIAIVAVRLPFHSIHKISRRCVHFHLDLDFACVHVVRLVQAASNVFPWKSCLSQCSTVHCSFECALAFPLYLCLCHTDALRSTMNGSIFNKPPVGTYPNIFPLCVLNIAPLVARYLWFFGGPVRYYVLVCKMCM